METPNLDYINELAGDDIEFKNKFIEILKVEFPVEKTHFLETLKNKKNQATAAAVHKLKHKFNILGLQESYRLSVLFEEELLSGNNRLKDDFLKIINSIEDYIKTI